jgi:hypothetical protein
MKLNKSNLKYGFILIAVFNFLLMGVLLTIAAVLIELLNIL